MKRLPAKSLNEESIYVACQRDKRKLYYTIKKDPNDPRTLEELKQLFKDGKYKEYYAATESKSFQTDAWIRGEEYPMPWKIRMPEEGDILCAELLEPFPNDEARKYHAENDNV